jgi:hypothetical protein
MNKIIFTKKEISKIEKMYKSNIPLKEIAKIFEVSEPTLWRIKKENKWPNIKGPSIIGQKFNKLTAIEEIRSYKQRTKCKCKCDCGSITIVDYSKLKTGYTKSCGCIDRRPSGEVIFNGLIYDYKSNAEKKNIEYILTRETAIKLFQSNCFYCNLPPSRERSVVYETIKYSGIDRLDNNIGYTNNNCVSCCMECNYFKNVCGFKNFILLIRKIHKNTHFIDLDKFLTDRQLSLNDNSTIKMGRHSKLGMSTQGKINE